MWPLYHLLCCKGIALPFLFGLKKASSAHEGSHFPLSFNRGLQLTALAKLTGRALGEGFHHGFATLHRPAKVPKVT